jgi:hypothetical protein
MTHESLSQAYLDEAARADLPWDALIDVVQRDVELTATTFRGRCMSRPVFLSHDELTQLASDLEHLHSALAALPQRLFGGDRAAFARAVGATEVQAEAIKRRPDDYLTRMARADMYLDDSAFRLMECNMGSTAGGGDNARLNRAFLSHPVMAGFAETANLSYVDSMGEIAHTLQSECGIGPDDGSLIAAIDWPGSYEDLAETLRYSAQELKPFGITMVDGHLGQLSFHDRRVWLGDKPIDAIYRVFMIEDLLDPTGPDLINPVLDAAQRGEVKIFSPIDSELFGSKAALALLSDEAHRHRYPAQELASLDRLLPWTRMVRTGDVTVDGERVDLLEYAYGQQQELILKPTLLHAGKGVVPGWRVEPDQWRQDLTAAVDQPFVLQRRIRPVPELFPAKDGMQPWVVSWGAFLCTRGYGGMFVRGVSDPNAGTVNMATGASGTCCFHERPPAAD